MTFKQSSEQAEFQNVLRSFFEEKVSSEYVRFRIENKIESDSTFFDSMKQLDLSSYFRESKDAKVADLSLLAFEVGRSLVPENVIENLCVSGLVLFGLLTEAQRKKLDQEILAAGFVSPTTDGQRFSILPPHCALVVQDSSESEARKISGLAKFVANPTSSNFLLLQGAENFFLVPLVQREIEMQIQPSLDLTVVHAQLELNSASAWPLPVQTDELRSILNALKASEIAGACDRALEMTKDYVTTRKQFSVPIGGFQAIQHKLADMLVQAESMKSLARFAAWACGNKDPQMVLASGAALTHACENGPLVLESAIQAHGGIGFTWEYDLHLYLRRVRSIVAQWKAQDADHQRLIDEVYKA